MFQIEVVEKIKTHILYPVTFFFENCAVYEIMWENIVWRDRPQRTIWRMCIACWVPKATNSHSEYVIILLLCVCVCVCVCRLLSKNLKIKIYRTIILPVVLYGCEAWSLTAREER